MNFNEFLAEAEDEELEEIENRLKVLRDALFTPGELDSYRRNRYELYEECIVKLRAIQAHRDAHPSLPKGASL